MAIRTLFSSKDFQSAFPRAMLNFRAWPKRRSDREIILLSIAAFFDFEQSNYREVEVNDLIMTWIAIFGHRLNLDHVTLRRELVDARILARSDDGSSYSIIPDTVLNQNVTMIRSLDLELLLSEERNRRALVRQRYRNSGSLSVTEA